MSSRIYTARAEAHTPEARRKTVDVAKAISLLKQGEINGLETLVKEYQVQAVRAAYLITQDRPMAEDVVATAFLRVYDRIQGFDPSRPFRPWFLRIVVNDAVKAVGKERRQVSLYETTDADQRPLADRLPDQSPGPQELAEKAEVRQAVSEALRTLSPAQRAAIIMRYYLGLSEQEIAGRFQRTPGTVKRHLHDGRKRLYGLLRGLTGTLPSENSEVREGDQKLSPGLGKRAK